MKEKQRKQERGQTRTRGLEKYLSHVGDWILARQAFSIQRTVFLLFFSLFCLLPVLLPHILQSPLFLSSIYHQHFWTFNLPLRIQGLFLTCFTSLKTSSDTSSHLQTNGRIYGCTGSEWDWLSAWEFVLQTSPLLTLVIKTTIIMDLWYQSAIQLCSLQTPLLSLLRLWTHQKFCDRL